MLSGRRLDLLDPSPFDIELEDIAHGLARVARFFALQQLADGCIVKQLNKPPVRPQKLDLVHQPVTAGDVDARFQVDSGGAGQGQESQMGLPLEAENAAAAEESASRSGSSTTTTAPQKD